MRKKEIISRLAELNDLSYSTTEDVLNDFLDLIIKEVDEMGEFKINGFGKFELKTTKERTARNPKTGEAVLVQAKNRITFKPSANIKKYIN